MKGWSRMKCPFCGHDDSKVVDSRPTDEGTSIRRRRECLKCFKRFTTYETVERMPLMLVKRDGTRQPYDRQKLLGGLVKACEKRPVSLMQLEQIVDNVEQYSVRSRARSRARPSASWSWSSCARSTRWPMCALRLSTVSSRISILLWTS